MTRQPKKLALARETLVALQSGALDQVGGGNVVITGPIKVPTRASCLCMTFRVCGEPWNKGNW